MPVVIPLAQCVARPPIPGEEPFWLVAHLEAVAESCGRSDATPEEKLAFLAGLAHDAAKTAWEWQDYIRGNRRKGPPHAPLGAALFAFWSERLIPCWEQDRTRREALHDLALDWVRMIYRHHGGLDDLEAHPPWIDPAIREEYELPRLLTTTDQAGLDALVHRHFPEYTGSLEEFPAWFNKFDKFWHYRQHTVRPNLVQAYKEDRRDFLGLRLADLGAGLIFADRRHVAEWEPISFEAADAESAIQQHARTCDAEAARAREINAADRLIDARGQRQAEALQSYMRHAEHRIFTLLLPTGYGKTLTGLRVALEGVRTGRCRRIVYVAPYISILSQSARQIEAATGLPVFLHYHLSILAMDCDPKKKSEDRQREDHQSYDLLDTWQAPIIATTFNQLFRALFPARAQECLRIPALEKAFIFVDEPQIIDVKVWCAFLRALAVLARRWKFQVLFSTATLPPPADGLGPDAQPTALVGEIEPAVSRYVIRSQKESWNATQVAEVARSKLKQRGSVAVILNTVADAVNVYNRITATNSDWFFLAAMMLPGHKADRINRIRDRLDPKRTLPTQTTGVVCTQVLEAGVDLSFRALLRALAVFSSIAQAAGRANRHAEGNPAEVIVFPFVRDDGNDSRKYVYKDRTANSQTDHVLAEHPNLSEEELPTVLREYYYRCWGQNPHTASLQWFREAALGRWSSLAGQEPFGGNYPQVDVFVPGAERYLAQNYRAKLEALGTDTAEGLLMGYLDPNSRRNLPPKGKERFRLVRLMSALLRQFTVAVPVKIADRIARPISDDSWLWCLANPDAYSDQTGLSHHLTAGDEADGVAII